MTIMFITICILILVYSILGMPVGSLVGRLKDAPWKELAVNAWDVIVTYSKKAGRSASRWVLTFYYTMEEGDLNTLEKALVYAGIIYIAAPGDLLPVRVLGWMGLIDDAAAIAWICERLNKSITPEIKRKVEETLDDWFGPEIVTELVADLR